MGRTEEYIAELHEEIKRTGYDIDSNGEARDCMTITTDISRLLEEEHKSPIRLTIYPSNGLLASLLDIGSKWGYHMVACADNLVFDPLIGKPVTIDEYPKLAFGSDSPLRYFNCRGSEHIAHL